MRKEILLEVLNEILFDITEGLIQLDQSDLYPENLRAVYDFISMNDFSGRYAEKLMMYKIQK